MITVIPKYQFFPIKPDGDGCMSLSATLHWIASKGLTGAPDACTDASGQYQKAAKEFSDKAISGKIRVIGRDPNQADRNQAENCCLKNLPSRGGHFSSMVMLTSFQRLPLMIPGS